ncbi:S8 family serine peptidase [Leptonema illini]|uniref:Peptidase S8 and S53 subtilisin kexin sedolisin n=1 Tax=Leptonema illini DSM 21528 TaxID=929563 RepID=H2CG42_9LEPT|nr:S8 family serine peptidase [Leptonema illini]EHQ07890.1 peptidase S8 and S53 subtilisin kexin sedolisin [Leptonema illini DSM 21528]
MENRRHKLLLLPSALFLSLLSCGGGGGDDDSSLLFFLLASGNGACTAEPLFGDQWHLLNSGQSGGTSGEDAGVTGAWDAGYTGSGVTIAIVDDGIDILHEDLRANINTSRNYNYVESSTDLAPHFLYATHGTSVAGVSAADCNGKGVSGVAPDATMVGYNLLLTNSDANNADAMTRNGDIVAVSNNSWGAPDLLGTLNDSLSSSLWRTAILDGINNQRNGKGIIYAWAAGNGQNSTTNRIDNSNYDGQANFRGVMAICAVSNAGKQSSYSERGANLWVCAPSNGGSLGITTTDIRDNYGYTTSDYTDDFGGTSSASPLVAGVVALMLQANPDLTWRDVRYILARTARKVDPTDTDWINNDAGIPVNHKYGFGVVDASAAVTMARTFTSIGGSSTLKSKASNTDSPAAAIPDNDVNGISRTVTVSSSGITDIEWVDIEVTFVHTYAGDLNFVLTSPDGTTAHLSEKHVCTDGTNITATCPFNGTWRFGAARFLDETADGTWTLKVTDGAADDTGTLNSWSVTVYGR